MLYPSYNTYMPYNTYGFTPQYQQQQQISQQPVVQKMTNCEWIFVNGIEQVKDHIVQPNQTFYFFDNNDTILYKKQSDNLGSSKISAYRITEINLNDLSSESVPSSITNDINALSSRISVLENKMKEAMFNESINEQSNYSINISSQDKQSSAAGTEYLIK